jgi:hypothetical protein
LPEARQVGDVRFLVEEARFRLQPFAEDAETPETNTRYGRSLW